MIADVFGEKNLWIPLIIFILRYLFA